MFVKATSKKTIKQLIDYAIEHGFKISPNVQIGDTYPKYLFINKDVVPYVPLSGNSAKWIMWYSDNDADINSNVYNDTDPAVINFIG